MDVDEDVKENKEKEDGMVDGADNGDTVTSLQNGDAMDEVNPLDASMNSMVIPIITKLTTDVSVLDTKSSDLMKYDKVQENGRKMIVGILLGRMNILCKMKLTMNSKKE
ncbi:P-loop containing nucleoside triphosphate hydrolases superfamily protein [Artemisia annua]|uniref:P-loop containing nucleoside triphosphate hydrolases superfamily protein n=1 Tax=Artemisia annua TaxID=35608 RepID=A0A2U1MF73_ARTAN|nr:P-loop containing nucleoside triphosphate hydrolases superfamily protein [Artemisia annua]